MRILILGGDGYLGWPTAMALSRRGHEVALVDNFLRRKMVAEMGSDSLTPILPLKQRIRVWKEKTGIAIPAWIGDLRNESFIRNVLTAFRPEAIIHYGEIPSAPYSMIDAAHAVFVHENNVNGTINLLFAMRDICPEAHLVKLGTMGEYGTPNIDIEEGWIEIIHNGRKDKLLYPKRPGSFYPAPKCHDSTNIEMACRFWGLRSTDLNQGVVYGIWTEEMEEDDRLLTRFDYDEAFGTVLNRYCIEAIAGYPLTIYGAGGQTRGFLNIMDTIQCVTLAVENPPKYGEYRVFNQFTEIFSVTQLAYKVKEAAEELGIRTEIRAIPNPRLECEEHYYNAKNSALIQLGMKPHRLTTEVLIRMLKTIARYKDRLHPEVILPTIRWKQGLVWSGGAGEQGAEERR